MKVLGNRATTSSMYMLQFLFLKLVLSCTTCWESQKLTPYRKYQSFQIQKLNPAKHKKSPIYVGLPTSPSQPSQTATKQYGK